MDHCRLHLDPEENKLVFIFHCRHGRERERERWGGEGRKRGEERCYDRAVFSPQADFGRMLCSLTLAGIVKTHQLGYQECVPLQAMFNKDLSPNHIAGPARYRGHVAMGDLSLELLP